MKYVLITGAYGGMGKEATRLFTEKGYTVFALDKKIEDKSEKVIPIEADITDENSIN